MATNAGPQDTWSRFALTIFRLNGEILRIGETISRSVGQSSARWQVLGRVCVKSQTVAEIAGELGYARQSVQRVADVLIQEGLLINRAHPNDKRTKLLVATRKGQQVMTAIYERQVAWSERVLPKLDPDKLAGLVDALQEVAGVLELEYQEN